MKTAPGRGENHPASRICFEWGASSVNRMWTPAYRYHDDELLISSMLTVFIWSQLNSRLPAAKRGGDAATASATGGQAVERTSEGGDSAGGEASHRLWDWVGRGLRVQRGSTA